VRQQIKVCIKKDPAAKIAAMSLTIAGEQVPLTADADGVIRVAGTRLPLDTIIVAFHQGATAEEIAQRFPVIDLADVYAVISYYLHNRAEVEAYLQTRREKAQQIRELNETRTDPHGLRERLLARRAQPFPPLNGDRQ
jgi:uncharacterized protein (DUF433 family)